MTVPKSGFALVSVDMSDEEVDIVIKTNLLFTKPVADII